MKQLEPGDYARACRFLSGCERPLDRALHRFHFEAGSREDVLEALLRYHRALGLAPSEYERIQAGWLAAVKPDGISPEEFAEMVHPSRYVRGSDVLDVFGR